ncbi:Serine/threonine-protein kinase SRPK [Cryptotermes secundus]|uniref:non-specific serine/threonine protein kinase n=1 Tax=Cryptotermes secundus TaxID=105785 RepID=A0A2J7RJC7_9NEOP|nr:Serine/threonine-protein kinase SRPK [Cryptotermes secundus]
MEDGEEVTWDEQVISDDGEEVTWDEKVISGEEEEDPASYCKGGYHPVRIGDCFHSRYSVAKKLGWGTFSTVWLCWDTIDKQYVALKVLKGARTYIEGALDEIDILKSARDCDVSDPNRNKTVELLNYFKITGVNGTHMCLVFEALGPSLLHLLFRSEYRGIPLANVKSITRQVLEGLSYLHTKCKIIHTDIKPENVLICLDPDHMKKVAYSEKKNELQGQDLHLPSSMTRTAARISLLPNPDPALEECDVKVKIADLGNACWVNHHFTENIQTQQYRSLEVILKAGYGTPADIWSTACMVFELATGNCLFNPRSKKYYYSCDEDHLALITELLGRIPREIAMSGKRFRRLFRHNCDLWYVKPRKPLGLYELLTKIYRWDHVQAEEFTAFLLPMLKFDPNRRATAEECLLHPWLKSTRPLKK